MRKKSGFRILILGDRVRKTVLDILRLPAGRARDRGSIVLAVGQQDAGRRRRLADVQP